MAHKAFPLSQPVAVHGGQTSTLELREPSFDDLSDFGLPVDGSASGIDFRKVRDYAKRLAVKNADAVGAIRPADAYPIFEWLMEELAPAKGKDGVKNSEGSSSP